jgi:hypothetical protein
VRAERWLRSHPMPEGIDIPTKPEWQHLHTRCRRVAIGLDVLD